MINKLSWRISKYLTLPSLPPITSKLEKFEGCNIENTKPLCTKDFSHATFCNFILKLLLRIYEDYILLLFSWLLLFVPLL